MKKKEKKPCRACGKEKPLSQFTDHEASADGTDSKCKDCYKRDRIEKKQSLKEYQKHYFVHDNYYK